MQPQQTHLIPLKPFQLPNSLRKCVDVSKFAIDSKLENKNVAVISHLSPTIAAIDISAICC